jgi:hypothetical protein
MNGDATYIIPSPRLIPIIERGNGSCQVKRRYPDAKYVDPWNSAPSVIPVAVMMRINSLTA